MNRTKQKEKEDSKKIEQLIDIVENLYKTLNLMTKRLTRVEDKIDSITYDLNELKVNKEEFLPLTEAAKITKVSRNVIRNNIKSGTLIHKKDWVRNGNRYLVKPSAVEDVLQ